MGGGYIRVMDKKMQTAVCFNRLHNYLGIMEMKMETTTI